MANTFWFFRSHNANEVFFEKVNVFFPMCNDGGIQFGELYNGFDKTIDLCKQAIGIYDNAVQFLEPNAFVLIILMGNAIYSALVTFNENDYS